MLCVLCGLASVPPVFAADAGYGQVLLDPLGLPYYLDAQGRPFRVDENGRPYRFRAGGGIEYLDPRGRPVAGQEPAGSAPDASPETAPAEPPREMQASRQPARDVAPEAPAPEVDREPTHSTATPPAPAASVPAETLPDAIDPTPAEAPPPLAPETVAPPADRPESALPEVEFRRLPEATTTPQQAREPTTDTTSGRTDMNLTALEPPASIAPSALHEEPATAAREPQEAREPTDLERFLSGEADVDWGERALRRFEPDTRLSRTEAAIDAAGLREAAHASTIRQRLGRLRGEQEQLMQQAQAELLRNGHTTRRFDDIADRLDVLRREIDELDRKLDEIAL